MYMAMYKHFIFLLVPLLSCTSPRVARTDQDHRADPAIQYDAVTEAAVYNSIQKQDTVFLNKEGEVTGIGKAREN